MAVVGQHGRLPPLPGASGKARLLQRQGEQPRRHLLARGDHGVIFAHCHAERGLLAPGDEFVGLAGHGRNHDRDLMTRRDLAVDVPHDILDALDGGDRGAAEFS